MPETHLAAIALGSNLPSAFGGLRENLLAAVDHIRFLGAVTSLSSFYETDPVGYTEQPEFLNGALLLETSIAPLELMRALLRIEQSMGRVRTGVPPKGPRIIDLDLLFVDSLVLNTSELTLPHPAMAERSFVLLPLVEIAAAWIHPLTGLTVHAMLDHIPRGLEKPLP